MKQSIQTIFKGILFFWLLALIPFASAEELSTANWYTVLYRPNENMLYWINENGQQATHPRPQLPQEVQFLDMRISPNGYYAVISATLSNGREGLGIYNFQTGSFVQVHQAQDGETIHLGRDNIFSADSESFAVGFSSGDFSLPKWRIILFETQSGNSQLFIDNTHPDSPNIGLSVPYITYLDNAYVHFQLIPQAVGGAAYWQAYKWQAFAYDPNLPVISEGPYDRAESDILPATGETVMTYLDESLPAAPQVGQTPNFNVVGRGFPLSEETLQTVQVDGTRSLLQAKWANQGNWVLFLSTDSAEDTHWNIVDTSNVGGNSIPFDPQFQDAFGVSDGYVLMDGDGNLLLFKEFMPNSAIRLFQTMPGDRLVYATPIGLNFELSQLGDEAPVAIITPTLVINEPVGNDGAASDGDPCANALVQRVSVGIQARVLPSMGALNVRQQPNGGIVSTLSGGTTFNIIGGPICSDGLYWWQIQRPDLQGWAAEGNLQAYFIEPYAGPATEDEPALPEETDTPAPPPPAPPGGLTTGPSPTPTTFFIVPEATFCPNAPATRLAVGDTATVLVDNPLRNSELAMTPYRYNKGVSVTVVDGPKCSGDVMWWLVVGQAFDPTLNTVQNRTGWVPEGSGGTYWLAPQ